MRNRELLLTLTSKEIRIRYKQSVMGFLWAILMPLLIVSAGIVVRMGFALEPGQDIHRADVASVAVRSIPWAFFVTAIRFAAGSLLANANLVTKIAIPKMVFPVSMVLASAFDAGIATLIVIIVLSVLKIGFSLQLFWLLPLGVILFSLTVGVALVLACANLFFRDVKYLVEIVLTFGIFFTPVFYEVRHFGRWAPVLMYNPVGATLELISNAVINHQAPDPYWLAYAALTAALALWGGWALFHKTEPLFAESI